ncbi:MAG: DUF423 domain-containing protein [Verrucomicrobiota bacterium]
MEIWLIRIAAVFGFLGVTLGAFGAHGLKEILEQNQTTDHWKTATFYHLVHAVVLFVLATWAPQKSWAFGFFAIGIIIFSGSLYILCVTGIKWLGAITPIGGICLLLGWLLIILHK